jgi:hypothetical protein
VSTIFIIALSPLALSNPAIRNLLQRFCMKVVKLVTSLPLCDNQSSRFEQFEMLRNALPRRGDLMFHCQPGAQLEQRLTVSLKQFVENRPPYRRRNRLKNVAHQLDFNRQAAACLL